MIKLNAAFRLKALHEVYADPFEGWINSLQFTYDRPEGANYVTVDASPTEVVTKLRNDGWTSKGKGVYTKGEHSCVVSNDNGKARITDRG